MSPQVMFPSKQVSVELSHVQLLSRMQSVKFKNAHVVLSTTQPWSDHVQFG